MNILTNTVSNFKLGNMSFDTLFQADANYNNNVTDYPAQDGVDVGINVRRQPEEVTFSGNITTSPIYNDATQESLVNNESQNRISVGYNYLLEVGGFDIPKNPTGGQPRKIKKPTIIDIVDGLRIFNSMVMVSMNVKSLKAGNEARITCTFKKYTTVFTTFTEIERVKDVGRATKMNKRIQKKKNVGAEKEKPEKSWVTQLLDGLKTKFGG